MTQSISVGFVSYFIRLEGNHQKNPINEDDDGLPWESPSLQVVDIQRYVQQTANTIPTSPSPASPSCFYIALSDTQGLIWAIAPPKSTVEQYILNGELEIGCVATVSEYAIVLAANRKRVLVILDISGPSSDGGGTCFSLIGNPKFSDHLFHLSELSLISKERKRAEDDSAALSTSSRQGHRRKSNVPCPLLNQRTRQISLSDLWEGHKELQVHPIVDEWYLYVRVMWKSKLRKIYDSLGSVDSGTMLSTQGGLQSQSTDRLITSSRGSGRGRYVFDTLVIDKNGDAVRAIFQSNGRKLFELFQVQDCISLANGVVYTQTSPEEPQMENSPTRRQKMNRIEGNSSSPYNIHMENGEEDIYGNNTNESPTHIVFTDRSLIELADSASSAMPVIAMKSKSIPLATDGSTEYDNSHSSHKSYNTPHHPVLPNQPIRLLSGAETDCLEIQDVLLKCQVGDVVNVRGIVTNCGHGMMSLHTRHGRQVDKLTIQLKDRATNASIEATLWGEVAHSIGPLPITIGTTWIFRGVSVRIYGNRRTLSSKSTSDIYEQPSVMATGAGGRQYAEISLTYAPNTQYPSQRTPVGNSNRSSSGITTSVIGDSSIPFSLSFFNYENFNSESKPILTKIEAIINNNTSLVVGKCNSCRYERELTTSSHHCGSKCSNCNTFQKTVSFEVILLLSDGLDNRVVNVNGKAGESLCGETAESFLVNSTADINYKKRLFDCLLARSILVDYHQNERYTTLSASRIQHVDPGACSFYIALLIDQYP